MKRMFIILIFFNFPSQGRLASPIIFFPRHCATKRNVDVRQVDISAFASQEVEELVFEEGDFVTKGLTSNWTNPHNSQVPVGVCQCRGSPGQFKNAEVLVDRRQNLIGLGGVSQEDLDGCRTDPGSRMRVRMVPSVGANACVYPRLSSATCNSASAAVKLAASASRLAVASSRSS